MCARVCAWVCAVATSIASSCRWALCPSRARGRPSRCAHALLAFDTQSVPLVTLMAAYWALGSTWPAPPAVTVAAPHALYMGHAPLAMPSADAHWLSLALLLPPLPPLASSVCETTRQSAPLSTLSPPPSSVRRSVQLSTLQPPQQSMPLSAPAHASSPSPVMRVHAPLPLLSLSAAVQMVLLPVVLIACGTMADAQTAVQMLLPVVLIACGAMTDAHARAAA